MESGEGDRLGSSGLSLAKVWVLDEIPPRGRYVQDIRYKVTGAHHLTFITIDAVLEALEQEGLIVKFGDGPRPMYFRAAGHRTVYTNIRPLTGGQEKNLLELHRQVSAYQTKWSDRWE